MTTRILFGSCVVLGLCLSAPAQEQPSQVLKKAIQAHGGEATLKMYPAGASKMNGTVTAGNQKLTFTGAMAFSVPAKVRVEMTFEVNGRKATTVQIINGAKVLQTENGVASKLSEPVAAELRESARIQEMSQIYPLLDPKKYTLAAAQDATFDGKKCSVVSIKAKGMKDVALAFDKKSGLLTAMSRKGLTPAGVAVDEVTIFSDYKTISGLKAPMKSVIIHAGKPFLELIVTEYKPLAKAEESLFKVE